MNTNNKQRFSFRKLTVGLTSVLLGITFMATANTNQVQAAEQSGTTQTANTQASEDSDTLEKSSQLARKDDDTRIGDSHVTQDQVVTSRYDGHNAQDLNNKGDNDSSESKPVNSNSVISNSNEELTSKGTAFNENSLSTTNTSESEAVANAESTTVATGSNIDNPADKAKEVQSQNSTEVEVRSKRAVAPALTTQDVINWDAVQYQKQADGNVDVTGWDIVKGGIDILLPNTWDFTQKGIISEGKQAGITADVMRNIAEASNTKAKAENKTYNVKISENGDGKLIAKDQDWSYIFDDTTLINGKIMNPRGTRLESANLSNLDTSNVTNMSYMFHAASNLQSLDVSNWDTSKVTNMSNMFDLAQRLQILDVSTWDTHNVTNMSYMFNFANHLQSLDVSKWDTSSVTSMMDMFSYTNSLQSLDVSKWDTSKVTDMSYMFHSAKNLQSLDVSNWDTHNVTSMYHMFGNASSLQSLDVSKWNTSNVTSMRLMFSGTLRLQSLDVLNWDTHNVTNMSHMFMGANSLQNLDLSKWDTSNVTNMRWMFNNASSLQNLDVSNWDTSKVTDMRDMFSGAGSVDGLVITANNYQGTPVPGDSDTRKLAIISNVKDHFTDLNTWGNRPKTLTIMVHDESTNTDHEEKIELDTIAYDSPEALRNAIREKLTAFKNSKTDETHVASDPILTSDPTNLAQELNATYKLNVKAASSGSNPHIVNPDDPRKGNQVSGPISRYVIHWVYADDDPYTDKSLAGQNVRDNANIVYQNYAILDDNTKISDDMTVDERYNLFRGDTAKAYGSVVIQNDLADEGVIASNSGIIPIDTSNGNHAQSFVRNGFIKNIPAKSIIKNGKIYVARKAIAYGAYSESLPLDYDKEGNLFSFSPDENWYDASGLPDNKEENIYIYYYRDLSQETLNIKVKYVDSDENGKLVTEQNLTGKLGDQVATPAPPENYIVDPSSPNVLLFDQEHVLDPDNNPYIIHLVHQKKTETDYNPATRTITIHNPDGSTATYVQTIGYKRNKITDLVTNVVTYGTYAFDDPTSSYTINGIIQQAKAYRQDGSKIYFSSIKIPKILGYKAVVASNNGIVAVSYRLLALPKQDFDSIKMTSTSDSKIAVLPVQSSVTITSQWTEQDNAITYNIKKGDLNVIVPKLDNYEFHLTDSEQNALAFNYANEMNTYKFILSYDLNGYLILHVENNGLNKIVVIKDQADLLKLIKSIVK